jgi:hypothetical protein
MEFPRPGGSYTPGYARFQRAKLDEALGGIRLASHGGDVHDGSVRTQVRLTTAPSYDTLKAREGRSGRHYPCAVLLD